mmetsp:Transcript_6138/g.9324  ORF Transcript_6138/g.9324 Transcript_6138/m.9324 type:complete len:298 (+) Transcript_6138:717-1610(+)
MQRVAQVASQGEDSFSPYSSKLCESTTNPAAIRHSDNDPCLRFVSHREGVRHKRRDEVAVTRIHLTSVDLAMTVLVVEVHRANEQSCLHHQMPVVELHVRIQGIATAHDTKLLDPLWSELTATAHDGITILVVWRSLACAVRSLQHPSSGLSSISCEKAHSAHGVICIKPEVIQRHRVDFAHLPKHVEGITNLQVTFEQAFELCKAHIQLLGNSWQRSLQVVRLAQEARAHGSHLRSHVCLRQEHCCVVPGPCQVLWRVDLVPAAEDHGGLDEHAFVHKKLQQIAEACLAYWLQPPR